MGAINFSQLTFTAEQVRDVAELIRLARVDAGDFAKYHTMQGGIRYDREIGFYGSAGLVGKLDTGCNATADQLDIPTVRKVWTPGRLRIFLRECYADTANTLALYAMKKGTKISDLTGTDYLALVERLVGDAVRKMLWRTWLMDKAAANAPAGGGLITAGVDLSYFNLIDGYWKQIAAIVAANPTQRTTLTPNAAETKALQFSQLTPKIAYNALNDATFAMPVELVKQTGKKGMITREFANQVKRHFQSTDTHPDAYQAAIEGIDVLIVNGIQFTIQDDWTEQILAYNDLGTSWHLPHRAIITTKDNLVCGLETVNGFETFDVFFDKVTDFTYMKLLDKIDVKVMQDRLIHVIY